MSDKGYRLTKKLADKQRDYLEFDDGGRGL
jgi:hypothetical protein